MRSDGGSSPKASNSSAISIDPDVIKTTLQVYSQKKASRYRTWQWIAIYFYAGITLSMLVWAATQSCQEIVKKIRVPGIRQKGWFMGRPQDLSDDQWRGFRRNIIDLTLAAVVFLAITNGLKTFVFKKLWPNTIRPHMIMYTVLTLAFLGMMHGATIIFLIAAAVGNFSIAKYFKSSKWNPILSWLFTVSVLLSSYYYDGFRFRSLFGESFAFLDSYRGLQRWQTYFKVSLCRFISFSMDYCWSFEEHEKRRNRSSPLSSLSEHSNNDEAEKKKLLMSEYRVYQETNLPLQDYSFINFFVYAFYPPLYLAGPICSFNAFISQVRSPQKSFPLKELVKQTIKVAIVLLALEISLHYLYYNAFLLAGTWKREDALINMPKWEVAFTAFWTLNFMYLKFFVIWRFFRLWALFDGINTPENMKRCICNNYTFAGFWRAWHGSMNTWVVRYVYKPLGGSRTQHWNMFVIFTFIALWHDLEIRWVAWAYMNIVFFLVELGVVKAASSKKIEHVRKQWWWGPLVAYVSAINQVLIMLSNTAIMLGFDGSYAIVKRIFFREGGVLFFLLLHLWLAPETTMVRVYDQYEHEDREMRRFKIQNNLPLTEPNKFNE